MPMCPRVNACVNARVAACKVIHWIRQMKYDTEPRILSTAPCAHIQTAVKAFMCSRRATNATQHGGQVFFYLLSHDRTPGMFASFLYHGLT